VTNGTFDALLQVGAEGQGALVLNSGYVRADRLVVTNGAKSVFTFNGGTLQSGNTTVSNGAGFVVGNGVSPGTFELVGGAHSFANGLSISSNGQLKGSGSVAGIVSVSGTLAPGASVGRLAIAGSLTFNTGSTASFELDKAAGTNDSVVGLTNLFYNGTLMVTNLGGTLANGDRFDLFDYTNRQASAFTNLVLPALNPGLKWRNKLMMDGSLEVLTIPTRDFGVDVSHFQGASGVSQASWNQMFAEGKRFVFVKATEGLTGPHDGAMTNNVARAVAAGLLVGVYHYAHPENRPTTNGAILEASNMVVYAGSAIGPGRLRPVIDIEGAATTLSTAALTDWIIAFSDEIIARRGAAAAPIIYCSQSSANFEFDSRLANYDLWVRTIGGSDPATDDPTNSFGFDPTGVFNEWSFWQYSDTGSSGGITPLDLDVCHSEYKPLTSFLIPGSPPTPIQLIGSMTLSNGAFQFSFTNTPGALFTVLATTNVALPLSNWTLLGAVMEVSPGQFQFSDPQTTNHTQRYYRVRSP
jgi:GH25 family lysozyme M1 (1,4-beta-N-acetylmuramidase)